MGTRPRPRRPAADTWSNRCAPWSSSTAAASRAAVPDVAALDAVQQVDPGLPDVVNRRQVAVLQAMAAELGADPSVVPEAAFAVPSSVLLRALLEWVANHSGVDEAVIRGWLRDVSAYLELPGCRPAVQEEGPADAGRVRVGRGRFRLGGRTSATQPNSDQQDAAIDTTRLTVSRPTQLPIQPIGQGMSHRPTPTPPSATRSRSAQASVSSKVAPRPRLNALMLWSRCSLNGG